MQYYARFKDGVCSYWKIYKKRKVLPDKEISKVHVVFSRINQVLTDIIEPELRRLEKEEDLYTPVINIGIASKEGERE